MRKAVGRALALALGCLAASAAPAAAAERCSGDDAALEAYAPPFVHPGTAFDVDVTDSSEPGDIPSFTLALDGVSTTHVLTGNGLSVASRTAPTVLGPHPLDLAWEQPADVAYGGAPPCSGFQQRIVTVVRPSVRLGMQSDPRVAGRWLVVQTPLTGRAPASRVKIAIRPLCDVGACSFRVRGARGVWRLDDDGERYTWDYAPVGPTDACVERDRNGRIVDVVMRRRAFLVSYHTVARVTRWRQLPSGVYEATRIEGLTRTVSTPTALARARGCSAGRDRVHLTLVPR